MNYLSQTAEAADTFCVGSLCVYEPRLPPLFGDGNLGSPSHPRSLGEPFVPLDLLIPGDVFVILEVATHSFRFVKSISGACGWIYAGASTRQ